MKKSSPWLLVDSPVVDRSATYHANDAPLQVLSQSTIADRLAIPRATASSGPPRFACRRKLVEWIRYIDIVGSVINSLTTILSHLLSLPFHRIKLYRKTFKRILAVHHAEQYGSLYHSIWCSSSHCPLLTLQLCNLPQICVSIVQNPKCTFCRSLLFFVDLMD